MISLVLGFVSGFVFKTYLSYIIINTLCLFPVHKKKDKINRIEFVCKVNDGEEQFVQPYWNYNKSKKLIKIDLTAELRECFTSLNTVEFTELFDLKDTTGDRFITLFLDYFKDLGKTYIYANYTFNNKNYINVYRPGDVISHEDFKPTKNKFENIICSYVKNSKTQYITDYIKMYGNNEYLTPQIIIDGNDNLISEKYTLNIIYRDIGIKNYINDEVI